MVYITLNHFLQGKIIQECLSSSHGEGGAGQENAGVIGVQETAVADRAHSNTGLFSDNNDHTARFVITVHVPSELNHQRIADL